MGPPVGRCLRRSSRPTMPAMVRLGIIGCGDVLFRSYGEGLRAISSHARVVACCDRLRPRADAAADLCARWGERPDVFEDHAALLDTAAVDGVLNLTPAPLHYGVTSDILASGRHAFSEKPLAGTLDEADGLIRASEDAHRLLLCAPATMVASRFQWLAGLLASGRLGTPMLAIGQLATLGPAAWREYTGDPRVFYSDAVGPVVDLGVYVLHAITGLLGPAVRVGSVAATGMPERRVLGSARVAHRFQVTAPDLVLLQLELRCGALAQVLCGFAVPASRAPMLELHFTGGTITMQEPFSANGTIDVWVRDESPSPLEGWLSNANAAFPRSPVEDLIACGPVHFVRCLLGEEAPVLTAEHARHVLEISVRAHEAARAGCVQTLDTSFDVPSLGDRIRAA